MKPTTLATLFTVLSIASMAMAQQAPVPPPPVPPAPPTYNSAAGPANETADPRDLSTINGQLVPIGEHNEYHYSFRRADISTDPLGWMVGFFGVSGSYALSQHLALRGEIDFYKPVGSNNDENGFELDAGLPIYFRRTYQGLFLEPGFMVRSITTTDPSYAGYSSNSSTTDDEAGPQVLVGWHWSWDSGLNFAIAGGIGRSVNASSSGEDIFPNGYMRFGYEF